MIQLNDGSIYEWPLLGRSSLGDPGLLTEETPEEFVARIDGQFGCGGIYRYSANDTYITRIAGKHLWKTLNDCEVFDLFRDMACQTIQTTWFTAYRMPWGEVCVLYYPDGENQGLELAVYDSLREYLDEVSFGVLTDNH